MKILSIVFTILALLAAGGAGGVYYLTEGKLEEKTAELDSTRNTLGQTQDELAKAKAEILSKEQLLENTRSELSNAKKQNQSVTRKLVGLQASEKEDKRAIESLTEDLKLAQADNSNLRKEIFNRKNAVEEAGGADAEELAELQATIADLEDQVEFLEGQLTGSLPNEYLASEEGEQLDLPDVTSVVETHSDLEGTIARVNSQSGILVLAKGSDHGIQERGEYTLKKGGYVLAKVRVTNLASDYTVATIVPNVGIPNSLRSGDLVDITR